MGSPLEGVQHQPGAPWGGGEIPGKGMGPHVSQSKGQQESPDAIVHGCPLVIWQDDAVGKAPVLGST